MCSDFTHFKSNISNLTFSSALDRYEKEHLYIVSVFFSFIKNKIIVLKKF